MQKNTFPARSEIRRIVWAIDVFGSKDLLERTAQTLQTLAESTGASIYPVYVSLPSAHELIPSPGIQKWLESLGVPSSPPLTVLREGHDSNHAAALRLLQFASESSADLIALEAKATPGLSEPLIGHFAKAVMRESTIPLFIVGMKSKVPERFVKILFPTEFSQDSEKALGRIIPLAEDLGAKIEVFHETKCLSVLGEVAPADCFEQSQEALRERGKEWSEFARSRGADIDVNIDDTSQEVPVGIVSRAEEINADLIAMATQTGSLAARLFGTVTEEVVSQAPCPVWVMHEPRERMESQETQTSSQVSDKKRSA